MQRAIKFRVWHKEFKKFLSSDEWLIDLNGQLRFLEFPRGNGDNATDSVFDIINENLYTIQQFTGLLDANNKEIYEGDKLVFAFEEETPQDKGIVKWDGKNGNWYVYHIKWQEVFSDSNSRKWTIVGHINK